MAGYETKQERIATAGVDDLVVRSLLDRQLCAGNESVAGKRGVSSASWSLFGLIWASELRLATRLTARPLHTGERILEVGCGLADTSLVHSAPGRLLSQALVCGVSFLTSIGRDLLALRIVMGQFHEFVRRAGSTVRRLVPFMGQSWIRFSLGACRRL